MSRDKKRDNIARSLSLKAKIDLEKLNNITVVGLVDRIETLEGQLSTLNSLQTNFNALALKLQNYETHQHKYEDDNGTTQPIKDTQGVT